MKTVSSAPDAAIAHALEQMQDNFLFSDGTAAFLPTCLVELARQNDNAPALDKVLDMYAARRDAADGTDRLRCHGRHRR